MSLSFSFPKTFGNDITLKKWIIATMFKYVSIIRTIKQIYNIIVNLHFFCLETEPFSPGLHLSQKTTEYIPDKAVT